MQDYELEFRALCVEFGVLTEAESKITDEGELNELPCPYSGKEDAISAILQEESYHIDRYVAVTRSSGEEGEWTYLYCFPTFDAAVERATEFIGDSLFEEFPVCVVDLETGDRHVAKINVTWERKVNLRVQG
jgi:hypothetical protein